MGTMDPIMTHFLAFGGGWCAAMLMVIYVFIPKVMKKYRNPEVEKAGD